MSVATSEVRLVHGRVELRLSELRTGAGSPLLVLHELGGSVATLPEEWHAWPGVVWGLDLTGHGRSSVPQGGGATPEQLLGDVDAALQELGPATLLGFGLGAYLALLAAGALPEAVRGAILAPGAGLEGGGPEPRGLREGVAVTSAHLNGAELLCAELSSDVRPPGYARLLLRQAAHLSGLESPVIVASEALPGAPWLEAVAEGEGAIQRPLREALAQLDAGLAGTAG